MIITFAMGQIIIMGNLHSNSDINVFYNDLPSFDKLLISLLQ